MDLLKDRIKPIRFKTLRWVYFLGLNQTTFHPMKQSRCPSGLRRSLFRKQIKAARRHKQGDGRQTGHFWWLLIQSQGDGASDTELGGSLLLILWYNTLARATDRAKGLSRLTVQGYHTLGQGVWGSQSLQQPVTSPPQPGHRDKAST